MSKVPKLRFKEFSGEWEEKKLNDVGLITTGSTPSTSISEYYGGERLFVSPVDIQGNRYINKTKTTLTELGFSKGRKVVKDSVCFVCIGSTIGKVAQLTEDSLTNQQINCITANNKNFNDFVYSLLELKASKIKLLAGEQALPQINKSDFSKLKFYLPSLQEQEKIASFLISVDTRIEQLTKKEKLLQQYKKGVIQKIFNQEIRFRADDGSEFCDWEEKKLDDVLKTVSTKLYQIKNSDILSEGLFKVVDQGQKTIAGYSNDTEKVYSSGDIIVYGDHTTIVKYIDFDFIVGADGTKLLNTTKDNNLKYMYYNLVFNNIEAEGYKRHFSILRNITLQIPSLKEQIKIANFLSSIDSKIEQVQKQLNFTKEFKKALLQKMFI